MHVQLFFLKILNKDLEHSCQTNLCKLLAFSVTHERHAPDILFVAHVFLLKTSKSYQGIVQVKTKEKTCLNIKVHQQVQLIYSLRCQRNFYMVCTLYSLLPKINLKADIFLDCFRKTFSFSIYNHNLHHSHATRHLKYVVYFPPIFFRTDSP